VTVLPVVALVCGVALVATAAYLVYLPAALAILGVALVIVGLLFDPDKGET
jgi:hypothetical protein